MKLLKPLSKIFVPEPKDEQLYTITLFDHSFSFHGLKKLLGAADVSKAGDRNVRLAAKDEMMREAARAILSSLTLQHLYDHPLTDEKGAVDSVMRTNYDIDRELFQNLALLTVGELKDCLLRHSGTEVARIGAALTGVMAAALTKLLDVHELIFLAKKIKHSAKARTTVGLAGTVSSRIQPNHPTDDLKGITLLTYIGLSMGMGDAIIGLNPAEDTVDNVCATLKQLDQVRTKTGAPTQICVLGHVKTQLAALDRGAPVEILFQSLAGTDRTLTEEFDVTVELLDQAYVTMAQKGALRKIAQQWMYFETGQGSEVSYSKHNGMDMTTCEALCYGLARRYDPFLVNNVTGFIGPETHFDNFEMILSNLQDHFMGKLLGLPMGMAPCYTLHSHITQEGQQMAIALLTAAGANYFMDVYLSADRMLAYFDTSGHDDQTMREVFGLKPAPEYLSWAVERGIYQEDTDGAIVRGPNWGKPHLFCESEMEFQTLREFLPGSYGFDNAGPRPENKVSRTLKSNQAVARKTALSDLRQEIFEGLPVRILSSCAETKEQHYRDPELGAHLSDKACAELKPEQNDIQILISDGLSAEAIHHNIREMLAILEDGLKSKGLKFGKHIVVPHGRVKLAEAVGNIVQSKLVILLIGERPGGDASSSRSMSAYLAYRLFDAETQEKAVAFSGNPNIRYEYTVISNIYSGGLPAIEAASLVVEKAVQILECRAAGNRLQGLLQGK